MQSWEKRLSSLRVEAEESTAVNAATQRRLENEVWNVGPCRSYPDCTGAYCANASLCFSSLSKCPQPPFLRLVLEFGSHRQMDLVVCSLGREVV